MNYTFNYIIGGTLLRRQVVHFYSGLDTYWLLHKPAGLIVITGCVVCGRVFLLLLFTQLKNISIKLSIFLQERTELIYE